MIRIDDASSPKRAMVHFFLDVARRVERRRLAREPVPLGDRCSTRSAALLVYGPLRDNLGMRRIRARLHRGRGDQPRALRLLPLARHQREAALRHDGVERAGRIQQDGDVKLDTVGTPLPGVEVRISDAARSSTGARASSRATTRTPRPRGRRSKTAGSTRATPASSTTTATSRSSTAPRTSSRLTDGTLFAPKYLENKLKFSPYVKEAVCVGPGRPFVAALVNIDLGVGGELGGAAEHRLHELHRSRPEARGLRADPAGGRAREPEPRSRTPRSRAPRSAGSCCSTRSSTPTTRRSPGPARCAAGSSPRSTRR